MKTLSELHIVDKQFLKAIDYLTKLHKDTKQNLEYTTDSAFGKLIYPTNRYFTKGIREEGKHVPHMALIKFAKHFNIDFNYFYTEGQEMNETVFGMHEHQSNTKLLEDYKIEAQRTMDRRYEVFLSDLDIIIDNNKQDKYTKENKEILLKIKNELSKILDENSEKEKARSAIAVFDGALNIARKKFMLQKELAGQSSVVSRLKGELDTIKKELSDRTVDLAESTKIALEAQRNESKALKRLLDSKD